MILEVNNVIGTQLNKTDKTSLIYNYVTGHEFRQEMESIVGTFMKLQDDLDSEIRQHQTQWKKREKELSILVKSTSNIYGSLKGIAGNSIKRIESLDIPKIEEAFSLDKLLSDWPKDRKLIYCDEKLKKNAFIIDSLISLKNIKNKFAVLVGPEGGFSNLEKKLITNNPNVISVSLGKRVLRSDTAITVALYCLQELTL